MRNNILCKKEREQKIKKGKKKKENKTNSIQDK